METVILFTLTIILFIVGLAGIVLPIVPSLPIIWLGILIYGLVTDFNEITLWTVSLTGILMLIGSVLDFLAGIFGAKASGASWYGVGGALIGSLIGFVVFNFFGLLIGSILGAFLGEYLKYRKSHQAIKAGVGTMFGIVFGIIIKIIIAFIMIGIFVWKVLL